MFQGKRASQSAADAAAALQKGTPATCRKRRKRDARGASARRGQKNDDGRPHGAAGSENLRRSAVPAARPSAAPARRMGGGGGGPPHPPFQRTKAPEYRLVEEHELVWDDGVAAETCLDFDAAHVDNGLLQFMGGFGFFAALATFIAIYSPKRLNQVTPRTDLVDPVALATGDEEE